jgi:hypothetical protein
VRVGAGVGALEGGAFGAWFAFSSHCRTSSC